MSYIISEDGKELLKDVRDFRVNEVKEQVKEYDISGEWPKEIYDKAIEMQLHMMDVPEEYGGLGLGHCRADCLGRCRCGSYLKRQRTGFKAGTPGRKRRAEAEML